MDFACGLFSTTQEDDKHSDDVQDEQDFEILFKDALKAERQNLSPMEKVWRYAKKPLMSIGAKGANFSHGNSLRQLLDAHTVVKVRVNTKQFGEYARKRRRILDTWFVCSGVRSSWLTIPLFATASQCTHAHIGTLEKAFDDIRQLAVESGAPEGIELVQARDKDKVIMFGIPGTLERIKKGDFPPLTRLEKDEQQDDNIQKRKD